MFVQIVYDCCMKTINISLPAELKNQADELVTGGFYASLSDLVRDSVRKTIQRAKYDLWAKQAKLEEKNGEATILSSSEDIEAFIESL